MRAEAALSALQQGDLLEAEEGVIRMRARAIEAHGWTRGNAVEDWGCVFAQGLPPAQPPQSVSDSLRVQREACLRYGPYESLVFELPQAGTDPDHPQRWRIRALRMLTYGYEVIDLFLESAKDGTWSVVAQERRSGVMS